MVEAPRQDPPDGSGSAGTPQPPGSLPPGALSSPRRRSRIGLFLPSILFAILVIAWTAAWFYIRHRAEQEMDVRLAAEAQAGRSWTCADRSIGGYPFRLELRCASLAFARSDGRFTLGPVTALVQIYDPRHGILEVGGPFKVEQGELSADVTWDRLEGSFHGASGGFSRISLSVDGPKGRIAGAGRDPVDFSLRHLEAHARPNPGRFESEGAVDLSLRAVETRLPLADAFVGNADPADLALDATLERAAVLRAGPVAKELDRWRAAGGGLEIALLSIAKGDRRIQGKGNLALDDEHRPSGRLDLRAAGLEAIVGQVMGQRLGAEKGALIGGLVGKLLGARKPARDRTGEEAGGVAAVPGEASLKPLPPLRFTDGRILLGPFAIPNAELPPLY